MGGIIKKYLPAIILLFIVILVWAGLAFFFDTKSSSPEVSIEIYTNPMNTSFSTEGLDGVHNRVLKTLPVQPKEFVNLTENNYSI